MLAQLLKGVNERPLDAHMSKAIGMLCTKSGVSDVVDSHVASLLAAGDLVLTSDEDDLRDLLREPGSMRSLSIARGC
jgi:hypothetical protein